MHIKEIHSRRRPWVAALLGMALPLALTGCGGGGGGGGGSSTSSGTFKDANVSGLSYVSGDESGTTNSAGQFTFENNSDVTFSINGVQVGTSSGAEILTPLEIAGNGSLSDTDVANIVRFLLMLDSDGNADNGIQISSAVRAIADDWAQPDFEGTSFDSDVSSIITEVGDADDRAASLPTAAAARDHFEDTLRCITAGAFKGNFSGDDQGTFGFLVSAQTGDVAGVAFSTQFEEFYDFFGQQAVSTDTQRSFTSGETNTGATFSGEFPTPNSVEGNWSGSGESGSFSGSRIGGDLDAQFRFTGEFGGDDFGLFSFDIDGSGNVTGVAYSVTDDEILSLTGSLTGTTLVAETNTGSDITGTLDTNTGSVSGNWSSSDGAFSGTFTGNGCQLN